MTASLAGNPRRRSIVGLGRLLGLALVTGVLALTSGTAWAKPFIDQLTTDFQAGIDDNFQINQNIQSGLTLSPYMMLCSWASANGPSNALYLASAVTYNGKVYVTGGKGQPDTNSSSGSMDTVLSAIHYGNILSDGSVEKWDPDKLVALPQPTFGHASTVLNGRLFILGGKSANATLDTVYYGKIFGHDGQIKALYQPNTWTAVAPLPTPLFRPALFQSEGRIYVLGGQDSSGATQSTIYYTMVQPSGAIYPGAWRRTAVDMPQKLVGHTALVSNGRAYLIGGSTDGTPQNARNTVYMGIIDPVSGDIPNWVTTTPLPSTLYDTAASITAGRLWVCGGATNGTAVSTSAVYHAGINQTTGLIPDSAQAETWTRGTDLPAPVKWHNLVTFNGKLLVIGGNNNTGPQKMVYTTTLVPNNTAQARWLPTTPLFYSSYGGNEYPVWSGHTAVIRPPFVTNQTGSGSSSNSQTQVFVLGGGPNNYRPYPDGNPGSGPNTPAAYSSVYQSNVDSNGALQTWSADPTKGQLPLPTILHSTTMAMNNQIYVTGGLNTTNAQIFAGAPSRSETAFSQPNTQTTWVDPYTWYYIGKTTVFYENSGSGSSSSLGSFDATSQIPILDPSATTFCVIYQPLIRAAAASNNDYIYVLGGISRMNTFAAPSDAPLNPIGSVATYDRQVWYCHPNPGGSINPNPASGGWKLTTPLPPAAPANDMAAVVANNRLYILGGRDTTGAPMSTVFYATFNSDGTLSAWNTTEGITSQSTPWPIAETGVVFLSGRIYLVGGSRDNLDPDTLSDRVLYCTPNPLTGLIPPPGSPGYWQDALTNTLDNAVAAHSLVGFNGYLYVLGGRYNSGTHVSSAYFSAITDIPYNSWPLVRQAFAWEGTFERYIDLDRDQYVDNLDWLGNANSETLRIKSRYALDEGPWSDWAIEQTVPPLVAQRAARYVHYKITMQTNTNDINAGTPRTPLLTKVMLNYTASKRIEEDSLAVNHNKFDPQVAQLMVTYKTRDHEVASVTLRVYNLEGELLRRQDIDIPDNTPLPATGGWVWDGTNENGELVANGVYIIQYTSGDTVKSRKVVVFKR